MPVSVEDTYNGKPPERIAPNEPVEDDEPLNKVSVPAAPANYVIP